MEYLKGNWSKHPQTKLAVELYQKLVFDDSSNVFLSPHSIAVVLSMILLGSKQKTAEELKHVLAENVSNENFHKTQFEILKQFSLCSKNVLNNVSNLFPESRFQLVPEFVEQCLSFYNASMRTLNFKTQCEESRNFINEWVEKETNGKIKDLLPSGSVSPDTSLVLANAVYFKGLWLEKFKETETTEMDFHEMNGKISKTKMMVQECKFNFCIDDGLGIQAVELPYEGKAFSMILLVPKERYGLRKFQETLTSEKLSSLLKKLVYRKVVIGVPRMKLEYKVDLVPALKALGITSLFDRTEANLEGISSVPNLYVSGVFHKTFLEVNEEGTEAAAATGLVITYNCVPPPSTVIICDHPFMFLIRHNSTQNILFMGRFVSC